MVEPYQNHSIPKNCGLDFLNTKRAYTVLEIIHFDRKILKIKSTTIFFKVDSKSNDLIIMRGVKNIKTVEVVKGS